MKISNGSAFGLNSFSESKNPGIIKMAKKDNIVGIVFMYIKGSDKGNCWADLKEKKGSPKLN